MIDIISGELSPFAGVIMLLNLPDNISELRILDELEIRYQSSFNCSPSVLFLYNILSDKLSPFADVIMFHNLPANTSVLRIMN